ncbi:myb-like DNA-binding domain protein [Trifolium medium]|uniref:Myb-like DNA-binding domain protein n=1 Tax=Trifolium medium TaxID=97028 RepID=A0A392NK66_9FABA|nr:myb-like DNA-binding domain protein [Trifolium medium]
MTDLADLYQPDLLLEEFTLACAAIVVVPVRMSGYHPVLPGSNPGNGRWSTLRKKDGSTNSSATATATNPVTPVATNTQYTAEQLATRHSLNLALDMPFKKLTAPGMTDPAMATGSALMGTLPDFDWVRVFP